jgi:hypothetical protein
MRLSAIRNRRLVFLLVLSTGAPSWLGAQASTTPSGHGIMRPDAATRTRWAIQRRLSPAFAADRLPIAATTSAPASFSILDSVPSSASRNQGQCGSCWVWASTALAEVALAKQFGIQDRLSVQYFQSSNLDQASCQGGTLTDFCNWYMAKPGFDSNRHPGMLVPWSNPNGEYRDGSYSSFQFASQVPGDSVGLEPAYAGLTLAPSTISTAGVSQTQAIANIQAALQAGKAVGFTFYTNFGATDGFDAFWSNQSGTALWQNDYEGGAWDSNWGGHMVTLVGWDSSDADPSKWYWVCLNQWGTTSQRADGCFRMPMKMNYQATFHDGSNTWNSYAFETLTLTGARPVAEVPAATLPAPTSPILAGQTLRLTPTIQAGSPPFTYAWQVNTGSGWKTVTSAKAATLNLPGDVDPRAGVLCASWNGTGVALTVSNASGSSSRMEITIPVSGLVLDADPGFDLGTETSYWAWSLSPNYDPIYASTAAHSGSSYARLTGYGQGGASGTLTSVPVTLPADPSVPVYALYYLNQAPLETLPLATATCALRIVDPAGQVLRELKTHTCLDLDHLDYAPEVFDITALNQGSTRIALQADFSDPDSKCVFRLDDAMIVSGAGATAGPSIASFSPATGAPGTVVTLQGAGLTGVGGVQFGRVASPRFTVTNGTTLQAVVPDHAATGPITVATAMGSFTSAEPFFAQPAFASTEGSLAQAMGASLADFSPASARTGDVVTLSGSNFTGATQVKVGSVAATTFTVTGNTGLTFQVPVCASTAPITVTTPGGVTTSQDALVVLTPVPPPAGTSFTPAQGPWGTPVTLTGQYLAGVQNVTFGGVAAPFTVVDDATLVATVPALAPTGSLVISGPGGTWTSPQPFTVLAIAPVGMGVSPAEGPAGTSVTLSGSHFTGVTGVSFNGASAQFSVIDDRTILTTVPEAAFTGPITIASPNGVWIFPDAFRVDPTVVFTHVPDNLLVGTSFPFAVKLLGSLDGAVAWSVQEGGQGGTIDAKGLYTAPSQPGVYHVVATTNGAVPVAATVPVSYANQIPSAVAGSRLTVTDLAYFMAAYGFHTGDPRFALQADLDGDGNIGALDLSLLLSLF